MVSVSQDQSQPKVLTLLASSENEKQKEIEKTNDISSHWLDDKKLLNKEDNKNDDSPSMFELDLLMKLDTCDEGKREEDARARVFKCNFCNGEYSSASALGGHQNAHREERAIAKRRGKVHTEAFSRRPLYPYHSYPRVYNNPIYGAEYKSRKAGWPKAHPPHIPTSYGRLGLIKDEGFQGRPSSSRFQNGNSFGVDYLDPNNGIQNLLAQTGRAEVDMKDEDASDLDLELKL